MKLPCCGRAVAPQGPICSQSPSAGLVGEGAGAECGAGRSHSAGLGEEGDGEATTAPEGDGSEGTTVAECVQGEGGDGGKVNGCGDLRPWPYWGGVVTTLLHSNDE